MIALIHLFCRLYRTQIAKSSAKALVGLPDDIDDDEPNDGHTSDDSPSRNLAVRVSQGSDLQTTDSRRSTSPRDVNEVQPPHNSSASNIPDFRSPVVDPTSPSPRLGLLQLFDSPTGATSGAQQDISPRAPPSAPSSPSSVEQPLIAASLSSIDVDDSGNLSDLTDLPTEVDSPPRSSLIALPVPKSPDRQQLSLSPSSELASGSRLKPKLVFDCVEIPQPEWYNGRRENNSPSRQKRKRNSGPLSSDIARSPESDDDKSPPATQDISSRSLSKRKRKMLRGPASR